MSIPKTVSAYMAKIGAKGGSKAGPAKARSAEHYQRMAALSAIKRRQREKMQS